MRNRILLAIARIFLVALIACAALRARPAGSSEVVTAALNGLAITLDAKTGGILGLAASGPGKMLEATPETAGIIELVCRQQKQTDLRRPRDFRRSAKISRAAGRVTMHWDDLGASHATTASSGRVAATVTLEAAADGRSVIAACRVDNQSDGMVAQVLFPDLAGFVPFGGVGQTNFRTGGNLFSPFVNLRPSPPEQLAGNPTIYRSSSGNYYGRMRGRWMDLGSLAGGLSLFSKCWGLDPPMTVWLHLWDTNRRLRMMLVHDVKLARRALGERPVRAHAARFRLGQGHRALPPMGANEGPAALANAGPRAEGDGLPHRLPLSRPAARSARRRLHLPRSATVGPREQRARPGRDEPVVRAGLLRRAAGAVLPAPGR